MSREEALRQAVAAVRFALTFFPEVEFSAEDASRSDYGFLREVVAAVHEAGAAVVNIPDTVGYALPDEYGEIFAKLTRDVPGVTLSAHCHDDLGLAIANSLAAVKNGARQVEVTINGVGERAGQHLARGVRHDAPRAGRVARPLDRREDRGDRHARATSSPPSPASGRSRTRPSSAGTPSRTRRGSTSTACSRTR